jgi:G protein-coupled receptor GPR1
MIMLLIQSDMAKAVWLIISPLFYFITKKPFSSNWVFCQISGFFLTVTIEACDIAVLLIAIHTALFIVKRQHPGAPVGLEPYRRIAYTLWAIVPIILAAIVPITGSSFVDNGRHCYLPIHPTWYRSALSWVPRYIISGFIIVTYTWLYLYVYIRFRRFGEDQRRASGMDSQSSTSTDRWVKRKFRLRGVPPTPRIATHGLLDSARPSMAKIDASQLRQDSVASTVSTLRLGESDYLQALPERAARKSSISWNLVDFGRDGSGSLATATPQDDPIPISPTTPPFPPTFRNTNSDTINAAAASIRSPEPVYAAGARASSHNNPRNIKNNFWKRRHALVYPDDSQTVSQNSLATIIAALRQGPPPAEDPDETGAGEALNNSSFSVRLPTDVSEAAMRRSRDRMQRQLRLLFVYPAIYMLTWIAPFVEHLYEYEPYLTSGNGTATTFDTYSSSGSVFNSSSSSNVHTFVMAETTRAVAFAEQADPFALRIVAMASLCIGAAVDCGFFSAWERPWRHLRGGFWEGLAMRLRVHRICGVVRERGGPGRNRDERVTDARYARLRRDRESETVIALRSRMGAASALGGESGIGMGSEDQRRRREWWDVLDDVSL